MKCRFFVLAPESPNFLRVRALDTASLNVTWMPPNITNGVIIEYTVQYGIDGTVYNESVRVGPDIYSVKLTNLECWVLYEVCVSASTSVGTGPEICDTGIPNVYGKYSYYNLYVYICRWSFFQF